MNGVGVLPDPLALALKTANIGILDYRFASGESYWSPAHCDILGTDTPDQPSPDLYLEHADPDDRQMLSDAFQDAATNVGQEFHLEHRVVRKDGQLRWVCIHGQVLPADTNVDDDPRFVACVVDITKWRSQQDSCENEARLRAILSIAPSAIISTDSNQKITMFNEAAEKLFGYDRREVIGQRLDTLIQHRYRNGHRGNVERFWAGEDTTRKMGERQDVAGLRKDGSEFPTEASISKIEIDSEWIFTVVLQDITERKDAAKQAAEINRMLEQRVAERTQELEIEMKRREQAQKQLIQSQRMEPFGQLTGGIAHDFNNLLAIVTGSLELMQPHIKDSSLREHIDRATNAAEMGARLTSRQLTFARHKVLEPVTLNLNDQVNGLMELLRRTLGEQVVLQTSLSADLWLTRVDPSEAENAILNLALNARDAMHSGGRLLIETSNVTIDDTQAREMKGMTAFSSGPHAGPLNSSAYNQPE